MKKAIVPFVVALVTLLWPSLAFSLMMERELRSDEIGNWPDWPPVLRELVCRQGIVYGTHSDAPTFGEGMEWMTIFFQGDHEAFNEMLEQYAELSDSLKPPGPSKEAALTLIIHPGRGNTASAGGSLVRGKDIAFDWMVRVTRNGTRLPKEKQQYGAVVEVWVGGEVDLAKMKVPLNVEVKSGREIEKFVARHEENRKELKAPE